MPPRWTSDTRTKTEVFGGARTPGEASVRLTNYSNFYEGDNDCKIIEG
jgi:hypothetical protein